jgi:hypothetical protein
VKLSPGDGAEMMCRNGRLVKKREKHERRRITGEGGNEKVSLYVSPKRQ